MNESIMTPVVSAVAAGRVANIGSADPANQRRAPDPTSGDAAAADASPSSASSSGETKKRPYPAPAEVPTQQGPRGIQFDFNDGCRVILPEADQPWRVRLSDNDTGNVLFETELKAGRINSTKRYFVPARIEVWQGGERVLAHDYSAADREVLI